MEKELNLVVELAIILVAAGFFTVISKALKQPVVLGYIIAGFVVGPHLGLFPQFSPESVDQWSELGIIFLLFGLGLEFNFKKLLNVGVSAVLAALVKCIGMFMVGFLVGMVLGWSPMERIFLGGMLGMSSTTIIIKAYDDLGFKNRPYASLVFGSLVVEDLLAVLIMVIFSTLAVSNNISGGDMLISMGKLVMFLVLCFVVGIYVIPTLFKRAGRYISDEILLLISVGLCFALVVLANVTGFSSALGAFLMGSILSSTIEGERIEGMMGNFKNLFGAVFFVSVGMMVEPAVIASNWLVILIITIVSMLGIIVFSTAGVLLAGKKLDTAVHAGFSLAQLGEFAFIIAGLGCTLGVVRGFIYPVIISVSVITTFTTPYMIKAADPVSRWLYKVLPGRVLDTLDKKATQNHKMNMAETGLWTKFIRKYILRILLYSMILYMILVLMNTYLPALKESVFPSMSETLFRLIEAFVTLAAMVPFLYGLGITSGELKKLSDMIVQKDSKSNIMIMVLAFIRIFIAVSFILAALMSYVRMSYWNYILLFVALVALFFLARKMSRQYNKMEDRFIRNLNAKEEYDRRQAPVAASLNKSLGKYDIHTMEVIVRPEFNFAGDPLRKMPFRKTSGVNIAKIQRGTKSILVPSGSECIYPGDKLVAVGNDSQLEEFRKQMNEATAKYEPVVGDFVVEPLVLDENSTLVGVHLKDTNLRPSGCLVVSVERNGNLFPNPDKDFRFDIGDVVWIAGLKSSIDWIKK